MNARELFVEGAGALGFEALSPPGPSRLCRLPFYLVTGAAGFHALSPSVPVANVTGVLGSTSTDTSTTHPIIAFRVPTPAGATLGVPFLTGVTTNAGPSPVIETTEVTWATLRIVGFEFVTYRQLALSVDAYPLAYVRDLQLGGGATLFSHEDYAPAEIYAPGQVGYSGLRDYPLLDVTNTASVQVQYAGTGSSVPAVDPVLLVSMFSATLICDVVLDDDTGARLPGPWARPAALRRSRGK